MKTNQEIQFASAPEIKAFQEARLAETLEYLAARSAFYQNMFSREGIDIRKIRHIEDLSVLPLTSKDDLQKRNGDFVCVNRENIIDYVTTSGTLGDPVTFALTGNDLDRLGYNEKLSFTTAGCTKSDVLQLMTTIDRRFMAGLAYFLGAKEMGMGVIRVGNGIPELQWDTIRRVHPTAAMVVPSFLLKLVDYAGKNGIDYHNCSLRKAVCIGESLRDPYTFELSTLGQRIHEAWP